MVPDFLEQFDLYFGLLIHLKVVAEVVKIHNATTTTTTTTTTTGITATTS